MSIQTVLKLLKGILRHSLTPAKNYYILGLTSRERKEHPFDCYNTKYVRVVWQLVLLLYNFGC